MHDFLEKFLQRVLITYSVLSSIGAFELMEFQNRLEQLDFPKKQQTALNILRDYMISKNIAVIEHEDFFIGDANFNKEPDLCAKRNCIILRCRVLKVCLDNLIQLIFFVITFIFYCIAPPKLCIYPLAPSLPSNTK